MEAGGTSDDGTKGSKQYTNRKNQIEAQAAKGISSRKYRSRRVVTGDITVFV
ncbi:hypothetical protein QG37_00517 [Candidozyma auris]|nr:hypothetical protein QG37_00517 [[Candida] auris]